LKDYSAEKLVREFPSKDWHLQVVAKVVVTGLVNPHRSSGRRCCARTADTIDLVDNLVLHKSG